MSLIANNKLNPQMVQGQNQIHATLVEGKHSHHCTKLLGADTTYHIWKLPGPLHE